MCFPPNSEILKKTKKIVKKAKAKRVFVATDNDPMIKELSNALKSLKVCNCFVCFEQRHQGVAEISTGAVVVIRGSAFQVSVEMRFVLTM